MDRQIITVRGPLPVERVGVCDGHNHLWISDVGAQSPQPLLLEGGPEILEELQGYRQAGGGSQIDCQPGGAGRDGNKLRQLSEQSGVNIIACTGFHLRPYYPESAPLWNMNCDQAAEYFQSEIDAGLVETRDAADRVYPGFIKTAALESVDETPLALLEAAVITSKSRGLAIQMHTERGASAQELLDWVLDLGLDPSRLVLCHMDKRPDLGLHRELAEAGCALEYDTFFRPKYEPEANVWRLLPQMIEAGHSKSVVLATDLADKRMWRTMGDGPGLVGFVDRIKRRVEQEIDDPAAVKGVLGGNIAHRLGVTSEEPSA